MFSVVLLAITVGVVWHWWPRLPEGVTRRHATINARDVAFLVVPLPSQSWRWELLNDPAHPKTVQNWRTALHADIVYNAAYFLEDNSPVGYLSTKNERSIVPWPTPAQQADVHDYTFMASVNALGDIVLAYLPQDPQEVPSNNTLLSFPTLLANGTALLTEDSHLYAQRTVLTADADGVIYLVIINEDVSLYEVAQWLVTQPEHFVIAGNLDGGPSTGVSMENGLWDVEDASAPVPSVFAGYRE